MRGTCGRENHDSAAAAWLVPFYAYLQRRRCLTRRCPAEHAPSRLPGHSSKEGRRPPSLSSPKDGPRRRKEPSQAEATMQRVLRGESLLYGGGGRKALVGRSWVKEGSPREEDGTRRFWSLSWSSFCALRGGEWGGGSCLGGGHPFLFCGALKEPHTAPAARFAFDHPLAMGSGGLKRQIVSPEGFNEGPPFSFTPTWVRKGGQGV